MRTKEEIKQALEEIERDWKDADQIPEYIRGQYVILKWILGEEVIE